MFSVNIFYFLTVHIADILYFLTVLIADSLYFLTVHMVLDLDLRHSQVGAFPTGVIHTHTHIHTPHTHTHPHISHNRQTITYTTDTQSIADHLAKGRI